ncbi:Ferric reductase NAD binding domain [Geosmithia morbida]|uniref:ferric-chelate reductase (NADPH) n=1 Tax=Geosmithia morbida TaxID=1094350 RepID=A0A9P5D7E4_9HYPO|nr:Ferric reductase NAD binding domain [Geosmithia morbida]KAF4124444.1 Ferric reductase NAD binding domain [Geosmithia morbida]
MRDAGLLLPMGTAPVDALAGTATIDARDQPASTITPYYNDLNGVNQTLNMLFKDTTWWSLGIAALVVLTIRLGQLLWSHVRLMVAMDMPRDKQQYWKVTQWSWTPLLKKHLLYAPLFKKRHSFELRMFRIRNLGSLPSRLHTILLTGFFSSNLVYIAWLDYTVVNKYSVCAELRGRSGTLALVNMVPLIIFAGRNNPLIGLLQISFDTYNLLHRWLGRIVVLEVVLHTIAWLIPAVADLGWKGAFEKLFGGWFLGSGWIGAIVMVLLSTLSLSPIRHAFYETFLNLHIIMGLVIFACTWIHCATPADIPGGLPQLPWIIAIVCLWCADRVARFIRLAFANCTSKGFTEAICEPLPGNVTRVTMHLPRHMKVDPGSHAYLRFWDVNPWETHPFSIAWVQHRDESKTSIAPISEKNPLASLPTKTGTRTSISFLIAAQEGMTRKLLDTARHGASVTGKRSFRMPAALEGPYAGHHSLDSYGHTVLFAGATGITHQLSYMRHILHGYNAGTVATRRLTLFWVVREYESLEWVRPYMDSLLRIPNRKDILRINVFVTRPTNAHDITNAGGTSTKIFAGRPNIPFLLVKEVQEQVGAMCVTVCGPGAMADDVRAATRAVQGDSVVDFIEESFTW